MRWFIGSVLGLILLLSAAHASAEESKTVALVIGIDEYEHIGNLHGAVNDAVDIAEAVKALPNSEVTMLLNQDATREAILNTWRAKADTLNPGDTFIITYAGHGGHEPEAYKGNEVDGQDETLLLGGFRNAGDAA
ncbi:MAG: caspase family protein, partial [Pseudomonadota bacterium]